jgi:hypothetical protein
MLTLCAHCRLPAPSKDDRCLHCGHRRSEPAVVRNLSMAAAAVAFATLWAFRLTRRPADPSTTV